MRATSAFVLSGRFSANNNYETICSRTTMARIYIGLRILTLVLFNKERTSESFRVEYVEVHHSHIRCNHQLDFAKKRFTDRALGHRDVDSRLICIAF